MSDTKENTEELFPLAEYEQEKKEIMQFRSYMSSPFIAESLPLKDVRNIIVFAFKSIFLNNL